MFIGRSLCSSVGRYVLPVGLFVDMSIIHRGGLLVCISVGLLVGVPVGLLLGPSVDRSVGRSVGLLSGDIRERPPINRHRLMSSLALVQQPASVVLRTL